MGYRYDTVSIKSGPLFLFLKVDCEEAQLPVCLAEETRAGVPILHNRQEAPVTGGLVTIVCG
jgi:hypothetical protein